MGHTVGVHAAFGIVLFVVVAVGILVAVASFVGRSSLYDQIGRGGLTMDSATPDAQSSPAAAAIREEEIRQMLEAQNARRERHGKPPLDIEAETARLLEPQIDAGLREEIRQLVIARNARRARQGKEPLDVEAEIARQITELGD
ncbi:MAG: hypothetical protein JWN32_839 [Solirubrobacterales bacterium]|jgi:hypothetical protein|nr:hypothetical protein [Solirubrobacterales bacterium]